MNCRIDEEKSRVVNVDENCLHSHVLVQVRLKCVQKLLLRQVVPKEIYF